MLIIAAVENSHSAIKATDVRCQHLKQIVKTYCGIETTEKRND